jgi:hypothetical protein
MIWDLIDSMEWSGMARIYDRRWQKRQEGLFLKILLRQTYRAMWETTEDGSRSGDMVYPGVVLRETIKNVGPTFM